MSAPSVRRRIRNILTQHNVTQAQLARKLGVPRSTLHAWLSGYRKPDSSGLRLLAILEHELAGSSDGKEFENNL